MDEAIDRASYIIDHHLVDNSIDSSDIINSQLTDIRNFLQQLLEFDTPKTKWIRLFSRQLKRLLDQNDWLSKEIWIKLYDDFLYTFEKINGEENKSDSWIYFLEKMKFESILEQRQLQFDQTFGEQKEFYELFYENEEFLQTYLHKCISFHSKMEVRGLIKNIDDLFGNTFEQTDTRKFIEEKLNCMKIPFNWSNRLLESVDSSSFKYNPNNFLPSLEQIKIDSEQRPKEIEDVLQSHRWLVILGDPGCAKTTLLRWITHVSAENITNGFERFGYTTNSITIRIPILIRVGEFAEWLNQHQTKTLIDYIGEHTWFKERYCNDGGDVLKQLIYHGHALILLDGLDEIPEIGQRKDIVELVRKFIDEYVRTPDFISAFDDTICSTRMPLRHEIFEIQRPHRSRGNQIIITSRTVGYQLYPIHSSFIKHYSLSLMNHEEAKTFIERLMKQVEKSLLDVLLNEGIVFDEEKIRNFWITRYNAMKSIFESGAQLLLSNPFLLTLICTLIIQSSDEFHPKSRIEVYHRVVQVALRSWNSQQSNISESMLTNVMIDLAIYLHLQSQSGLIDGFDMKQLCCLTFRKQGLSNNRTILREYADKLLKLLNSNVGIVSERSLQVFGFLHLSFQEYFVAQSFIRGSSIEEITNRILSYSINPRFRESLILAIGWISWQWSFDDYDQFCQLLFTPIKDYVFPFGTILFFDTFNDLYRLPSNPTIFIALNSLLDHPSNTIAPTYLMINLSKLHTNIILEWIQEHVCKELKRCLKFCQCLPVNFTGQYRETYTYEKLVVPIIFEKLRLVYNMNTCDEFVIDQFLRELMKLDIPSVDIFNNQLSSYRSSYKLFSNDIHPSILSVIVAVSGGIYFRHENNKKLTIEFSPEKMIRESSILLPIINYFNNTNEHHSMKIQTLIKQYENILEKISSTDISLNTIDTFTALICLQGVSQPTVYQKYHDYQALLLAINRLKRTWFYLRRLYKKATSLKSEVESIMNIFFSQPDESIETHIAFSLACAAAWKKLDIGDTSDWLNFNILRTKNLSQYLKFQPEFNNSTCQLNLTQATQNIRSLPMSSQELIFLLNFIPQTLQQLYYYLVIAPTNTTDSLPLIVLLSESLILLETLSEIDTNVGHALSTLQPLFIEYGLENYALVLLGEQYISRMYHKIEFKDMFKDIEVLKESGESLIDKPIEWKTLINTERQRIEYAKNNMENLEKDLRLFTSSVSLARIYQGQYRFYRSQRTRYTNLSPTESIEVRSAIENIHDSVLQIIARSIILKMKNPSIFTSEEEDQLQKEMIHQLEYFLPNLSLSKSTLLFIRTYVAHPLFPVSFKLMANVIGEKLIKTLVDKPNDHGEAAFIALQQLNHPVLSFYLSEFSKQTKNISDCFQFNSIIFHQYFTRTPHLNSSSTILLSSFYLAELAFDIQILKIYNNNEQKQKIPSLDEFKCLWGDSWKTSSIMTFEVAMWITNYLPMLNRKEVYSITLDISNCKMIEKKALLVINKWLDYRTDKKLRFFQYFAALQLVIEGSNSSSLINIINEMFTIDRDFQLRYIVSQLFISEHVDLSILRQILVKLHENTGYTSRMSICIERKEILELIFNLELERIISNERRLSTFQTRSYLSMIAGYSEDLQIYLIEYLRLFIDLKSEIDDDIKDKFLAIIITWIVKRSVSMENRQRLSIKFYECIFTFLDKPQFSLVQKAIFNSLYYFFVYLESLEENILLQQIAFVHLINVINSYTTYSEDILSICLLALGNCLLKSNDFEIKLEILNIFNHLFETSSSEIISIRAAFCLIFIQYSNVTSDTIQNWFRNKLNLTIEKKYQILLQQNLYNNKNSLDFNGLNSVIEHIRTYSTEIMDKFVLEFYNYLCKDYTENYYSISKPNFIHITKELIEEDVNIFQKPVQRSSFGEGDFKKELYRCFSHSNNGIDCDIFINLYAQFGTINIELANMLESSKIYFNNNTWDYFNHIKQLFDQDVIKKLFEILDYMLINTDFTRFSFILRLFVQLAQIHLVSLFKVHQHISNVIENLSYDHDYINQLDENRIFQYLLNLSCAKETHSSLSKTKLITEKDINKEFDNELYYINKKSVLYLKRNYFLKEFRTVFSNSN